MKAAYLNVLCSPSHQLEAGRIQAHKQPHLHPNPLTLNLVNISAQPCLNFLVKGAWRDSSLGIMARPPLNPHASIQRSSCVSFPRRKRNIHLGTTRILWPSASVLGKKMTPTQWGSEVTRVMRWGYVHLRKATSIRQGTHHEPHIKDTEHDRM